MKTIKKRVFLQRFKCYKNTRHGAGDRTRTGTLSPAVDFESTTSTNSITPAWNSVIIPEAHPNCKCKFTVNPSEFKKLGLPNGRELWYDIVDKLCGGF